MVVVIRIFFRQSFGTFGPYDTMFPTVRILLPSSTRETSSSFPDATGLPLRDGHILCADVVSEARYTAVYRVLCVEASCGPDPSKHFASRILSHSVRPWASVANGKHNTYGLSMISIS